MTKDEALAVRKANLYTDHYYKAKIKGGGKVQLHFLEDRLSWFELRFHSGFLYAKGPGRADAITAALMDRLGEPGKSNYRLSEDLLMKTLFGSSVLFEEDLVAWSSAECNTVVSLLSMVSPGGAVQGWR